MQLALVVLEHSVVVGRLVGWEGVLFVDKEGFDSLADLAVDMVVGQQDELLVGFDWGRAVLVFLEDLVVVLDDLPGLADSKSKLGWVHFAEKAGH